MIAVGVCHPAPVNNFYVVASCSELKSLFVTQLIQNFAFDFFLLLRLVAIPLKVVASEALVAKQVKQIAKHAKIDAIDFEPWL